MSMDALDEFFATWSEPEAWCGICATRPAIHVVLRNTSGLYGGVTSHVRIWDPAMQMHVAVCRQCCQQRMASLGQRVQPSGRRLESRPRRLLTSPRMLRPQWIQRLVAYTQALLRLCVSYWRR